MAATFPQGFFSHHTPRYCFSSSLSESSEDSSLFLQCFAGMEFGFELLGNLEISVIDLFHRPSFRFLFCSASTGSSRRSLGLVDILVIAAPISTAFDAIGLVIGMLLRSDDPGLKRTGRLKPQGWQQPFPAVSEETRFVPVDPESALPS